MVFSAFELRVDLLMAMQLNGSEVEALLPPANATNVSASGALLISAIMFRCAQGTAGPPCHRSGSKLSVWRFLSATRLQGRGQSNVAACQRYQCVRDGCACHGRYLLV